MHLIIMNPKERVYTFEFNHLINEGLVGLITPQVENKSNYYTIVYY